MNDTPPNDQSRTANRAIQQAISFPLEQTIRFQRDAAQFFVDSLESGAAVQQRSLAMATDLVRNYTQSLERTTRDTEQFATNALQQATPGTELMASQQQAPVQEAQYGQQQAPTQQPQYGQQPMAQQPQYGQQQAPTQQSMIQQPTVGSQQRAPPQQFQQPPQQQPPQQPAAGGQPLQQAPPSPAEQRQQERSMGQTTEPSERVVGQQ